MFQCPFTDDYILALHKKILTEELRFPKRPVISDTCKDLIFRMLIKDPRGRISMKGIRVRILIMDPRGRISMKGIRVSDVGE